MACCVLRTMCSVIRYNEVRVTWRGEPESRLSEHQISPVSNRNLEQVLGRGVRSGFLSQKSALGVDNTSFERA